MNRDQGRGWGRQAGRGPANRGRGRANPRDAPHSQPHRFTPQQPGGGIYGPSANDVPGNKDSVSTGEMVSPQDVFPCSCSKYTDHEPTRSSENRKVWRPSERKEAISHAERLKEGHKSTEPVEDN